jgi:hypothetical protein
MFDFDAVFKLEMKLVLLPHHGEGRRFALHIADVLFVAI